MKIISGAQTGVDRAALDAAMACGVEVGGWCPEGRLAEDGVIPDVYPVQELIGAGYRQRTKQNVVDSDGTLIIYFDYLSGGTEQTVRFCMQEKRPYVLVDAEEITPARAIEKIKSFIQRHNVSVLNVAGPRGSGEPRAYPYAKQVVSGLFQ